MYSFLSFTISLIASLKASSYSSSYSSPWKAGAPARKSLSLSIFIYGSTGTGHPMMTSVAPCIARPDSGNSSTDTYHSFTLRAGTLVLSIDEFTQVLNSSSSSCLIHSLPCLLASAITTLRSILWSLLSTNCFNKQCLAEAANKLDIVDITLSFSSSAVNDL